MSPAREEIFPESLPSGPSNWLDRQSSSLKVWVTQMKNPLLVSKEDGSIIWVNLEFERLLGYTFYELVSSEFHEGKKWTDLTVKKEDLEADQASLRQVMAGLRSNYTLYKSYESKNGDAVPVMIHVMRFPESGTINFFLVSILKMDGVNTALIDKVNSVEMMIGELISKPTSLENLLSWCSKNKTYTIAIILFLVALIVGERSIELADAIKQLFLK